MENFLTMAVFVLTIAAFEQALGIFSAVVVTICAYLLIVSTLYPSPTAWWAMAGVFLFACLGAWGARLEKKEKKTIEFMIKNDLIEDTITNTGKRGYQITNKGMRKLREMEANGGTFSVAHDVLSKAERFSEKERLRARHDSTGTPEPE